MHAITGGWHWIRGYLHGHTLILKLDLFVEILFIVSTEYFLLHVNQVYILAVTFVSLVFVL